MTLIKKPLTERLKNTGYLLKYSWKVVGMDSDIKTPTMKMLIFDWITVLFIFGGVLLAILGQNIGIGTLLIGIFVLLPWKLIFFVKEKAKQSWIVYNTITGNDISYHDASRHTKKVRGTLRSLGFLDILFRFAGSTRSQKGGFASIIINIFLAALREVWDLVSNYMIPAVVIEQKKLRDAIPAMKSLKANVPATLVGVFGLDFVGNVVMVVLGPIFFLILLLTGGLSFLLTSAVPIIVGLLVVFLIGSTVKVLVESAKTIYYTIFYTTLRVPSRIRSDLKTELTQYLKMEATAS